MELLLDKQGLRYRLSEVPSTRLRAPGYRLQCTKFA